MFSVAPFEEMAGRVPDSCGELGRLPGGSPVPTDTFEQNSPRVSRAWWAGAR